MNAGEVFSIEYVAGCQRLTNGTQRQDEQCQWEDFHLFSLSFCEIGVKEGKSVRMLYDYSGKRLELNEKKPRSVARAPFQVSQNAVCISALLF